MVGPEATRIRHHVRGFGETRTCERYGVAPPVDLVPVQPVMRIRSSPKRALTSSSPPSASR